MDAVYFDHAATTPMRPEVREAMLPYLDERFGNPSSLHRWGREARAALEEARERISGALGARPPEILFVRGGTEADNLAVLGRARAVEGEGRRPVVAVSAVEHHAVLEPAAEVERRGGRRIVLPVDRHGVVDPAAVAGALREEPAVVSVMWVNNEVGVVQPVEEVGARCREAGVPFHTDAVQALGKVPVRLDRTPVDLATITGHKIYGPKGVGALYVREGVALAPLLRGGGQERRLRPGTEDVAGAAGLAEAVVRAVEEREAEAARLGRLRDRLEAGLRSRIPGLRVNGEGAPRAPHIVNVSVPGVGLDELLVALDMEGIAVSSGSACTSGVPEPSHVLRAMGAPAEEASLRFSLGRLTDEAAVERALEVVPRVVERLRSHAASSMP